MFGSIRRRWRDARVSTDLTARGAAQHRKDPIKAIKRNQSIARYQSDYGELELMWALKRAVENENNPVLAALTMLGAAAYFHDTGQDFLRQEVEQMLPQGLG